MYVPDAFAVAEPARLAEFIVAHPFATLVSTTAEGPLASHLPLELDGSLDGSLAGEARLLGHMAKSNPHWQCFSEGRPAIAIFHGPHAYVSPAWYTSGPAVPTWNYAAVHVRGTPRRIDNVEKVTALLDRLVARYESGRAAPWVDDNPAPFRAAMQQAIVAFELPVESVEGKFKLGQNRSVEDQQGTIDGLEREGGADALALAAFMRRERD
jgi:transcriptional regulator